jgi:hypothetical protein
MTPTSSQLPARPTAGRIDHIILLYRDRASQEAARREFTRLLRIDDWDEVGQGSEGIHILISWHSGIELICPVREVPAFQKHLAAHGEGFYCLVFGVASLDEAMAHIGQLTGRMPHALGDPPQKVYEKFTVAREAIAGSMGGVRVMLGEFEPKA